MHGLAHAVLKFVLLYGKDTIFKPSFYCTKILLTLLWHSEIYYKVEPISSIPV